MGLPKLLGNPLVLTILALCIVIGMLALCAEGQGINLQ